MPGAAVHKCDGLTRAVARRREGERAQPARFNVGVNVVQRQVLGEILTERTRVKEAANAQRNAACCQQP